MIYIALGANQSAQYQGKTLSPKQSFIKVIEILHSYGIETITMSGLWESPAWPDPNAQPAYKNAVVQAETRKTPLQLLACLQKIECDFGRRPSTRNAPRPLDLDILDFAGQILTSQKLNLPHPRMCQRGFVLLPLQELNADWHDPIKNRAIMDWIARLRLSDVEGLKYLGKFS